MNDRLKTLGSFTSRLYTTPLNVTVCYTFAREFTYNRSQQRERRGAHVFYFLFVCWGVGGKVRSKHAFMPRAIHLTVLGGGGEAGGTSEMLFVSDSIGEGSALIRGTFGFTDRKSVV